MAENVVLRRGALTDAAFMDDPGVLASRLHEDGRAPAWARVPLIGRVLMPVRHEHVRAVLKDDATFQVARGGRPVGLAWWMPPSLRLLADNMLGRDGAEHRRLRRLVDGAFRPGALVGLEGAIENAAESAWSAAASDADGHIDLAAGFARALPLAVICDMLGLPPDDRVAFARQAERFGRMEGPLDLLRMLPTIRAMTATLRARIAAARAGRARAGLIADLVAASGDGDALSDDELVATVFLLLMAGHETTTHLVSGSILLLLREGRWDAGALAALGARDPLVEELLRHVSPVQTVKPRRAVRDASVGDMRIARGTVVMPLLFAANRDPACYAEPDRFDPARFTRGEPAPVAFGAGPHFCLGHLLARMELAAALRVVARHAPGLTLAGRPRYTGRIGMRGIASLPVAP